MFRCCFISFLLLLCACSAERGNRSAEIADAYFVNADGSKSPKINLEVMRSSEELTRGLMYRTELRENRGMLFVFPDTESRSFWMTNTYIELDIIYVGEDFGVVSIQKRAKPLTTKPRPSEGPAKYVVEVNGGASDLWGVKKGTKLELGEDFR